MDPRKVRKIWQLIYDAFGFDIPVEAIKSKIYSRRSNQINQSRRWQIAFWWSVWASPLVGLYVHRRHFAMAPSILSPKSTICTIPEPKPETRTFWSNPTRSQKALLVKAWWWRRCWFLTSTRPSKTRQGTSDLDEALPIQLLPTRLWRS